MNYYNPYFYNIPISNTTRVGLLSRLFGSRNITFSSILTNTQKVLNVANQAIPLVKQVKPIWGNAKTMIKVMNEFKKNDTNKINKNSNNYISNDKGIYNNEPVFFA